MKKNILVLGFVLLSFSSFAQSSGSGSEGPGNTISGTDYAVPGAYKLTKYCATDAYNSDNTSQELFLGWQVSKSECEKTASLIQLALGLSTVSYQKMFFHYSDNGKVYGAIVDRNSNLEKAVKLKMSSYDEGYEDGLDSAL
jgi:hypothetical protein